MTLANAILIGNANAPCGIAFLDGQWLTYDLKKGTKGIPDYICIGTGKLPISLNESAKESLASLIHAELDTFHKKA